MEQLSFQKQENEGAEENPDLKEIKDIQRDIYFSKRHQLGDEMFMVSHGVLENEDGTESRYEKLDGEIGQAFDAHGIDKGNQLENLLNILSGGIDKNKNFYTAPFEVSDENRAGLAAALGTSGGTAYKAGLAVLTSGPHQTLLENGIKHVFINDVYGKLVPPLAKLYPNYAFHLLSEQKKVLEEDYNNSK